MINNNEHAFQFMLKEYEMLYSKFDMHYNAVEKTITLYFVIIGAIISSNSFLIKNINEFYLFQLSDFQIICSLFISILGTISIFKIIEHRILTITYVKSLNQNRKWFIDNINEGELKKYSLFEASFRSPKYFRKFRHFYWEILGISIINSSFIGLLIINLFVLLELKSKYYQLVNFSFLLCIIIFFTFLHLKYYKTRSINEELILKNKNLA